MSVAAQEPSSHCFPYRISFGKETRLSLSRTVTADTVEGRLDRFYRRTSGQQPIVFDLAEAEYVEVAALVNMIAYLVDRSEKSLVTLIGYPRSRAVRDFLALWRFADAVEQATGRPLSDYLLLEDHRYLGEEQTTYDGIGGGLEALEYDPDWNGSALTKRNFFEFTTFRQQAGQAIVPEGPFAAAPRIESRRWGERLIREVLNKHLGGAGPKEDIARVVIYEAMSNAIRHPRAKIIQVVSKFERRSKDKEKRDIVGTHRVHGDLRICLWDDGDTIAETLQRVLKGGKSVRAMILPAFLYDNVVVDIRSFDQSRKKQVVVSQGDEITAANATEPRLLLASLFPGVSRTAGDPVPAVEPLDTAGSPTILAGAPGIGLYALTRIAVDQFGGTVLIRSGRYRLIMQLADDRTRSDLNVRYRCKVTEYPQSFPRFRGNLIVVQLPVRPSTS
jgi:hypothetical protein